MTRQPHYDIDQAASVFAQYLIDMHTKMNESPSVIKRPSWINMSMGAIYLRHIFFDNSTAPAMWKPAYVIANVSIYDQYKNKGLFTKLVAHLHATGEPVVVENVLEDRFKRRLHFLGFSFSDSRITTVPTMIMYPYDKPRHHPYFKVGDKFYWWTNKAKIMGPFDTLYNAQDSYEKADYLGDN